MFSFQLLGLGLFGLQLSSMFTASAAAILNGPRPCHFHVLPISNHFLTTFLPRSPLSYHFRTTFLPRLPLSYHVLTTFLPRSYHFLAALLS